MTVSAYGVLHVLLLAEQLLRQRSARQLSSDHRRGDAGGEAAHRRIDHGGTDRRRPAGDLAVVGHDVDREAARSPYDSFGHGMRKSGAVGWGQYRRQARLGTVEGTDGDQHCGVGGTHAASLG